MSAEVESEVTTSYSVSLCEELLAGYQAHLRSTFAAEEASEEHL